MSEEKTIVLTKEDLEAIKKGAEESAKAEQETEDEKGKENS